MNKPIISFKLTSWKKFLFLALLLSLKTINGVAQNYVDVSLKEVTITGEQPCPPSQVKTDIVIKPNAGMSGDGRGWSCNLYLKSEASKVVGVKNIIYDLTWLVASNSTYAGNTYTFDDVEIWMYEYSGVQFPNTNRPAVETWLSPATTPAGVTNLKKVLNGGRVKIQNQTFDCIGFPVAMLDSPYEYSGNNSLVIYVQKKTKQTIANPSGYISYRQNKVDNTIRCLANWEGDNTTPLPNVSKISGASMLASFARVVFNRSYSNSYVKKFNCIADNGTDLDVCLSICSVSLNNPSFCEGENANLVATPKDIRNSVAPTYKWDILPSGVTDPGNVTSFNITKSGKYQVTMTATNLDGSACTSTKFVDIVVKPKPDPAGTITGSSNVCSGTNNVSFSVPAINNADSYIWTYSGTGATITNNGKDITINFASNATSGKLTVKGKNTCGEGNSSQDFDITVTTKPIISDITKSICSGLKFDTIPVANATNTIPAGTKYTWTVVADPEITGESPETSAQTNISQTLSNSATTSKIATYTVTATSGTAPNQCTSTFKVTVTVKPKLATPTFINVNQPTCNTPGTAEINNFEIAPATYVFNPSTGISNNGKNITAVSGKYKFVVIKDGCASDSSALLTMNDVPDKPVLEGQSSVCMGSKITLKAWKNKTTIGTTKSTSAATTPWTKDDIADPKISIANLVDPNTTSIEISTIKSGDVKITYTDINACTAEQTITVNPLPIVAPITGLDSVCARDFTTLKNSIPNGVWSSSNPMIAGVTTTGDFQTKLPGEVIVYYEVTSPYGCKASVQKKMVVKDMPALSPLNGGNGVCIGSQMELKASIPGGVWTCLTPQFADLSFNYLYPKSGVTGMNMVELKYQLDQKYCNASISEFVKIYPKPKIEGYAKSICVGDTTTFKDIENRNPLYEKTIWSLINNSIGTIDNNGLLKAIKSGGTEVLGKNVFGCTSQGWIDIRPTALFDDTTINVCSGAEKSLIPIIKNASTSLNPTFKWTVNNNTTVDGETEMLSLVPAFKQTLTNKSGSDQTVNYLLTSSVGTGSDVCFTSRKLNVMVSSALDIVGPANIDLTKQIQYTSLNKSFNSLNWTTSNPQVIMVNANGLVSPKGVGSAIISVSNALGCSAQMNVNVMQTQNTKITGQNIVCEGSFATLTGFGNPKSIDPWTSSNVNVLTVSIKGEITALKAGKALVTYVDDQGIKDTMTINVKTTPGVDPIPDYTICPGMFNDSIKFKGTVGASFEWTNSNTKTGLSAKGQNIIYPFNAINNGTTNVISEISIIPTLGGCVGTTKKFNIVVRTTPNLSIYQVDSLVCSGGTLNFKTELTPTTATPVYQWYVNDAKVGANSAIYWSKTLKNKDKISVSVSSKDFCPKMVSTYARVDSLRLSMNVPTMVYLKAPVVNLVGYPSGGVFSGKGITNNKLDPSILGVGNKTVRYTFKNANNCAGEITQKIVVYDTVFNNCHQTTYDTINVVDTVAILKVKFKLTTGIKANQETSMRVYPNPTSDILLIEAVDEKAMAGYRYKILDAAGKEVYNQPVKSAITEISLKSLGAPGTYFLEVLDEKIQRVVTKKILLD